MTDSRLPARPAFSPGLRDMALSALFFSLMGAAVKLAGRTFPTMELVFARGLVVSALALADLARRGVPLRAATGGLLLARGLVGFGALTCFYYGVIHLPLADVTVIHFTNPVFTALLAAAFLAEPLRRRELALALAGLAGVVLVARPATLLGGASPPLPLLPVAAALTGAVLASVAYVLVRHLRRHDTMVLVFHFAGLTSLLALPAMLPAFVLPRGRDWLVLAAVGVTTFLGQVFLTRGLQRESAGRATAVGYLQIVFASLWGALLFGDLPGPTTFAGAAVIVASTIALARSRRSAPAA